MLVDIFSIIIVIGIIIFLIYSIWELSNSNKVDSNGFAIIDINRYKKSSSNIDDISILEDLFMLIKNIFKFIIMAIVVVSSIALEVAWLGFLFGSVIGCILMLIFFAEGFLLPLGLIPLFSKILYDK